VNPAFIVYVFVIEHFYFYELLLMNYVLLVNKYFACLFQVLGILFFFYFKWDIYTHLFFCWFCFWYIYIANLYYKWYINRKGSIMVYEIQFNNSSNQIYDWDSIVQLGFYLHLLCYLESCLDMLYLFLDYLKSKSLDRRISILDWVNEKEYYQSLATYIKFFYRMIYFSQ
jgi:hypothetical protein